MEKRAKSKIILMFLARTVWQKGDTANGMKIKKKKKKKSNTGQTRKITGSTGYKAELEMPAGRSAEQRGS